MNMIERLMRNPLVFGLAALAILFLLLNTIKIVPETQQGVVLRLGQPVALVNRYVSNQQFGSAGAGVLAVAPFLTTSSGSTSACATSTWRASKCCRPTSTG